MTAGTAKQKVVIIGAGIIGATIAFNLSRRPDVDLTVIDHAQPGSGASSHSFAWINAFGKEPLHYHELNRQSMNMWDRLVRRLDADVGLRWGGEISWVSTEPEAERLRERIATLQPRGYAVRLIDEAELRRLEPGLNPESFTAGEFSENDGHVDVPAVVEACLRRVEEAGGTVHPNTSVRRLIREGDRVRGVQTEGGELSCDVVVLAAGLGVTSLAALVDLEIPQQESPGVVGKTGPLAPVFKTTSVLYTPPLNEERGPIHIRQYRDGRLMIGEGSQESVTSDDSQEHAEDMLSRAIHHVPAIKGASISPVPVGYRPMPLDGFPILGFTSAVPNLYVAVMHSGVTLAPLVGEFASLEIADGAVVEMFEPYRLERFG